MRQSDFLPLGSIVLLEGGVQKMMIVGRGLNVKRGDGIYFFDYSAVMFPDGLTGDQVAYFNHDGIAKVIAYGYMDEDSDIVDKNLEDYVDEHPDLKRITPEEWRALGD
ncbi:MAG: DUF4176 domain-containing protein [Clostridia bacterium]|nr:DUF4176 domain-containing protein [Clostridia bacterium]MCR4886552.1 DUF4176 domain-containing protein [Clostridiales bacterium]